MTMFFPSLLIAHLAIAQTTVVVTIDDGKTMADSTPLPGATVRLTRNGKELFKSKPTQKDGTTRLGNTSNLDGSEILRAEKPGYESDGRLWDDVKDDDPILLQLSRERPKKCTVTVQKIVRYGAQC